MTRLPRFRRNLWLLLGSCLLIFTAIGVQALILNLYLLSIGFREDFLGLFSFANTAGIGGAALLAGRVSTRFGCRRTLIVAAALLALSSAAFVAFADAPALLLLAVVNGISLAHIFVPCATFVMDNAGPTERTAAYSGYFTAQSLATVFGSLIGGILPIVLLPAAEATRSGYALTLVLAAALAGLAIAPLWVADDSAAEGSQSFIATPGSAHQQRRQARRDLFSLTACNALIAVGLGFVIPFMNVFFDKQLAVSTGDIGLIFALGSVAMTLASVAGPLAAARLGTVATIVVARALTGPILLGLGLSGTVGLASMLYVGRTFFTNLTWPVDNAFSMELVPPRQRSTLAALRSASWNLAWAVSSGLGGLMIVQLGFVSIFAAAALMMLAGSLAFYLAFHAREAQKPQPAPLVAATETTTSGS